MSIEKLQEYDLVVIGSGPAGEKGATQAGYFGLKVAIIEREAKVGGAAANTGTLPSKTLRETALMLSGFRSRKLHGVDLSIRRKATIDDFLHHCRQVTCFETKRLEDNFQDHGVDVVYGEAAFVDSHTLRVTGRDGGASLLKAKKVLIATGASPRRPEEFPFDSPLLFDSDTILEMTCLPERMLVIGGGVIGSEYACTFAALGVDVTVIDRRERLLSFLDRDVCDALHDGMKSLGMHIVTNAEITSCVAKEDLVTVNLSSGEQFVADSMLVAAGRISNTASLNLASTGVSLGKRGVVEVNEVYQTSNPDIYAAGDVIGFPALASTSMEQARLAVVHAFNLKYKSKVTELLPYGIYTIPEVSMAGKTEKELIDEGIEYVSGKATYYDNVRGTIIGDEVGFLKLLFSAKDMKLIGVHVIGENASEVVHIGLVAMLNQSAADLFIRCCFNHPTLGSMYKYATYDAMGKTGAGEVRA